MKLDKLIVHRLPGIPGGFQLEDFATVSVITGPNGSGKSSLTRAVRHLLWSDGDPGTPFSVEAFFTWEGASWKAVREEGMPTRWLREGHLTKEPDLPAGHVARCYELGLLDLVLPAGGAMEQQLAGIINQEMSGGVNLAQIADDIFSIGPRIASKRSARLQETTSELNTLFRQQKLLFVQEGELVENRKNLVRSNDAATVFNLLKNLKDRNEMTIELEAARFQINTFEKGQDKVRLEDNETLATLHRQRQLKKRQAKLAGTERDIRRQQLKSLDLPDQLQDCGLLERQVSEAAKLHSDVQKLQEELTRQNAIIKQILRELDPDSDEEAAGPQPGRDVYTDVSKAYSRQAELQALTEGLDALLALPELKIQDIDPESMAAYDQLRLWLKSPSGGDSATQAAGLVTTLVAAVSGWVLFSKDGNMLGVAAMSAGAALAGYSVWRWLQTQSRNKEIISHCRAAGISLNHPLQPSQVQQLVDDHTRAQAGRQTRLALRENLSGQHQRQDQKLELSRELLEKLRQEHGLALDRETPDLINLLNVIPRYREARDEAVALNAALTEKQKQGGQILMACSSSFIELGFTSPASVMEAEQLLEDLNTRLSERQRLKEEQQRYQDDTQLLQQDLEENESTLTTFWKRLGVDPQDDDHLVRQLVDQLPRWTAAMAEKSRLEQQVELLNRNFRSNPDLLDPEDAEKLTNEELDLQLEKLRTEIQARDGILNGISRIELQVEQARSSLQVAEAQAAEEAALSTLLETRDKERQSTLGRLLLDDVQQTYHHASRPKVLALASDNFRDFTQGRYELQVVSGADQSGLFAAFDVEKKENLGLAELSDGTRAQLLLAVRLAFIAIHEGAAKPPIFLDESMTSSDPQRFAAIAHQLAVWAASQQRQVLYLSSNPNDAKAWASALADSGQPKPQEFDLAKARKLPLSQPPSFDFEVPSAPAAPGGMSAAQYAAALGVSGLNPWGHNTETHLWYILQDDLPQLHRLLLASASTLGQLLSRKDDLLVLGKMSPQKLANLEARGHGLDAFFKNWRIGRNRPVTAETLHKSEAVGPTFMDKCRELLDEVDSDSTKFLAGLRGKKVKRFTTKNIATLESFFLQEGFLDPRDVLAEEDLLSHVYSAVQWEIKAETLHLNEVRALVLSWRKLLKPAP